MMTVKGFRLIVFGIDHQSKNSNFGTGGPHKGVPQQGSAQMTALELLIDGEPAQPSDRNRRITGKALCHFSRNVGQWNIRRGQSVITSEAIGFSFQSDITRRHAAANILGDPFRKIPVKCLVTTEKLFPVVL